VVVGGNFTGTEVAGELNSFLRLARRRFSGIPEEDVRVTLLNRRPRILKEIDEDLAGYAQRKMTQDGVVFKFGTTIREIQRDRAVLENGETLATRTVIWCAGIEPHPLIAKTSLPVDEQGYIRCERNLRVAGHRDVW